MYKPMVDGFKTIDILVLLPILLGVVLCLFLFSKLVDKILQTSYAGLFHFVLGIVIASTLMIVPVKYNYMSIGTLVCAAALIAGVALGFWMSRLEEKYKPQDD
jgi:putative membrane protein